MGCGSHCQLGLGLSQGCSGTSMGNWHVLGLQQHLKGCGNTFPASAAPGPSVCPGHGREVGRKAAGRGGLAAYAAWGSYLG